MPYAGEHDPLCYDGSTVLRNKAGLLEQPALDEFEAAMFTLRASEPWPRGDLTPAYYKRLHHHFFQDVYDWAGMYRTIRIAKGGNWFCYPEYIEAELERLFSRAEKDDWFTALDAPDFAREVASFFADLNAIHAFRDGNGRTQMALLSILTDLGDYGFNEDVLVPERVLAAMIESFHGRNEGLQFLIRDLIA